MKGKIFPLSKILIGSLAFIIVVHQIIIFWALTPYVNVGRHRRFETT